MILFDLFLIQFIVVFVIDLTDAVDSFKTGLKWILTRGKMHNSDYRLKPLDCSTCMQVWCGLAYLLITGNFTLPYIAFVCVLAASTGVTKSLFMLIEDIISTIINLIYKLLDKCN